MSSCLALLAQSVGDTRRAVETALGRPQMSRTTGKGEVWVYSTGVRVTFKDGVVASVEGLEDGVPARSATPASENMTVVPERTPPATHSQPPASGYSGYEVESAGGPEIPAWFWLCFGALGIVSAVCNILILIAAFRAGILWGLGSLFVPFVSLVFVLLHWHDTKKPFLIGVGAGVASLVLIFKLGAPWAA